MLTTTNLNLKKPEGTDIVNIDDLNGNMDILDNAVANKVDKVTGKQLSVEDYTTTEKIKLAGIAEGANNYTHPVNHPASIISQDAGNRFVTDVEKASWNAKETPAGAQAKADIVQANLSAHMNSAAPHSGHVSHALATAANDFLVASGVGAFVKKTPAEVKTIFGLGSAAYTDSTAYATAEQGAKADAATPQTDFASHLAEYAQREKNIDSYAAIQTAFDAFEEGEFVFPSGTYNISASISKTILPNKKIKIRGLGKVVINSTVPELADYTGIFNFTGDSTSRIELENIELNHTYASSDRGKLSGIEFNTFGDVALKNVKVNGTSDVGIWMKYCTGGIIINCQSVGNKWAGLAFRASTDFLVTGGQYNLNGGDNGGTIEGYGITLQVTEEDLVINERITIHKVKAYSNVGKGLDAHCGHDITFADNRIKGFKYNGISAVNESVRKDVANVKIINNYIDGEGMDANGAGIQAGSYGNYATEYGTLDISGNTVRNITYGLSYAILIENPNPGCIAPEKITIYNNKIKNGASSTGVIIRCNNSLVPFPNVIITGNEIHAVSCSKGIAVDAAKNATIIGNTITVDTGTVTKGISTSSACNAIINDNNVNGAATYTASIEVYGNNYQTVRGNIVQGVVYRDYIKGGRSIEYGSAAPTVDYHYQGSIVWNNAATVGQPRGWQCTVSGTPGTWVSMGNL